jgi:hypothetical protein
MPQQDGKPANLPIEQPSKFLLFINVECRLCAMSRRCRQTDAHARAKQ